MDDLFIDTPSESTEEAMYRARAEAVSVGLVLKPSADLILGMTARQIEMIFGVEKAGFEFLPTRECVITAHQVWYVEVWKEIGLFVTMMKSVSKFSIIPAKVGEGYFDFSVTIPDVIA